MTNIEVQIFEEMLGIYDKSIMDMKLLGELDWYSAAKQTQRRLAAYLQGKLNEAPSQLARECHADLQGYVRVKFGSDIMEADDCRKKGCYGLFDLSQRLVEIGGIP